MSSLWKIVLFGALVASSAFVGATTREDAEALVAAGQFKEAEAAFLELAREDSADGHAWLGLVRARESLGDLDGAKDALDEVISIPRVRPDGLFHRARYEAKSGSLDEAIATLSEAIRIGFWDRQRVLDDPDLVAVVGDPRFRLPLGRHRFAFQTSMAGELEYVMVQPPKAALEGPVPVLIGLGPGNESISAAEYMMTHYWGEQAAQLGWVVVAPAAPPGGWRGTQKEEALGELLDHLAARFQVEGGKFHLAGVSNGGNSAFWMAQRLPERFHSLVAAPAAPRILANYERLRGVNVRLFVGEYDEQWKRGVEASHSKLTSLGINSEMTVVPHEGHFIQSLIGDGMILELEKLRRR